MNSSTIRILDVPPDIADAIPVSAPRGQQVRPASDGHGTLLERLLHIVTAAFHLKNSRNAKAMRLCETISLGEKRFLAIVQVDEERMLIGGSASTVVLLTRLPETKQFSAVLLERSQPPSA